MYTCFGSGTVSCVVVSICGGGLEGPAPCCPRWCFGGGETKSLSSLLEAGEGLFTTYFPGYHLRLQCNLTHVSTHMGGVRALLVHQYRAHPFRSVARCGLSAFWDLSDMPDNVLHLKSMVTYRI
jgi:hypothetical protein